MPQQLGIRRNGFYPARPRLTGRPPDDVRALADAYDQLVTVIHQLEDRLARRLNELALSSAASDRPAAGIRDRVHQATDTGVTSYDVGTGWVSTGVNVVKLISPNGTTYTLSVDDNGALLTTP